LATRDTAGSAAAPAARWRKFRRGSFILNLPSHHSITSSARASSVGGTVMPSALAVVRLTVIRFDFLPNRSFAGLTPLLIKFIFILSSTARPEIFQEKLN